ncbi:MAG: alpha/beta hydrolase [Proteobacteria bacterium]|nr:MAG: alpha/beta hydrolase [Pseudomonadota bacterium]
MAESFLFDTPRSPRATLILAHGSGQPMDSPFMTSIAGRVAGSAFPIEVVRFNFPYMQRAVAEGRRRPPDRAALLESAWREAITALRLRSENLFIGGKSLGGRFASMVADEAGVDGVICFGYPFHPPGKPDRLRTAHLEEIGTPVLILQGERDPFGGAAEVPGYTLSARVTVVWMPDGDHGFKPRKSSGVSLEDNLDAAARAAVAFIEAAVT